MKRQNKAENIHNSMIGNDVDHYYNSLSFIIIALSKVYIQFEVQKKYSIHSLLYIMTPLLHACCPICSRRIAKISIINIFTEIIRGIEGVSK